MIITAELSFYPLTEHYEELVIDLVRDLRKHPDIRIRTGGMSTTLEGEYVRVFDVIRDVTRIHMQRDHGCILVAKYLNQSALDSPKID